MRSTRSCRCPAIAGSAARRCSSRQRGDLLQALGYPRPLGCALPPNVYGPGAYVAPSSSPVALSPRSVGRTLTPRWAPSAITDWAGGCGEVGDRALEHGDVLL